VGSSAAWPLAGAHRRLCLHASSHASFVLVSRKVLRLSIRKEEGGNIWDGGDSSLLMVYIRIKLQVDLQADKSSVVVKGPFFP
jgi:hypothetical protein